MAHNGTVPEAQRFHGKTFFCFHLYLVGKRFRADRSDGMIFFWLSTIFGRKIEKILKLPGASRDVIRPSCS